MNDFIQFMVLKKFLVCTRNNVERKDKGSKKKNHLIFSMQNLCRDLIYFCSFKMIIDGKNSVNLKHLRDFQNFGLSKFLKIP